ncbi:hypothetical protein DLAC_04027 [Tieghemostelium lacteum]|uniref:Cytochrome P450 family protein n=1 Tax=Tieghemostelium lacteum TaxID=361077 RepID=A0A151ZS27_TIELA|nr:hypothetical protein DLAC_04027 [Tieghemostelium lacteum]|eukprot:KYQ96730.1 hypothetical protein DLAC_04027 [Tieghemostelium lacteum]
MGDKYSIVLNDPEVIKDIFLTNPDNFLSRPHSPTNRYVGYDYKGIAFADESYWRVNKPKIVSAFSNTNLKKVNALFEQTTNEFISLMTSMEKKSKSCNPKVLCQNYTMNIIFRYVYSFDIPFDEDKKGKEIRLIDPIQRIFVMLGNFSFGDFISFLNPIYDFYLQHFRTEISEIDEFIAEVVKEHIETIDRDNPRDLVDSLILEFDITKQENIDTIVCFGREILIASTDSIANVLEWFFLLLANNQDAQEKCYRELRGVFEPKMLNEDELKITMKDRNFTPFFNSTLKETMRYKMIGPLGVPRVATKDTVTKGIFIPKGAAIYQNLHALSNLEQYWNEPNRFIPERFLNNSHSDLFMPFSIGKRGCLGSSLAKDELFLAAANILANFKISPLDGITKIDETSTIGLAQLPHHFDVKIERR